MECRPPFWSPKKRNGEKKSKMKSRWRSFVKGPHEITQQRKSLESFEKKIIGYKTQHTCRKGNRSNTKKSKGHDTKEKGTITERKGKKEKKK